MVRLCAFALVLMIRGRRLRPMLALASRSRAIVPYTAGGAIDIVSRTVAQQLSLQLGYPIVIESRPGAGGVIGTAAVAKADPDGHTILLTASSHTISPWVYSNLPYDTVGDLAGDHAACQSSQRARGRAGGEHPIGAGARRRRARQARRAELRIRRKRQRDPSQCRTVSPQRRVRRRARPIQGWTGGAGRSDERPCGFRVRPILPSLPFIREGKAVALGVSTSKRASALPDVPTTLEAGFAEFRLQFLGRHVRAGENPTRGRRTAPSRDRQGAAVRRKFKQSSRASAPTRCSCSQPSSTPMFATKSRPTRPW